MSLSKATFLFNKNVLFCHVVAICSGIDHRWCGKNDRHKRHSWLCVSQRFLPSLYVFCDRILCRDPQQHEIYLFIWLKMQNASDSNVIYLCLFSKRLSSGFSLVFSSQQVMDLFKPVKHICSFRRLVILNFVIS